MTAINTATQQQYSWCICNC